MPAPARPRRGLLAAAAALVPLALGAVLVMTPNAEAASKSCTRKTCPVTATTSATSTTTTSTTSPSPTATTTSTTSSTTSPSPTATTSPTSTATATATAAPAPAPTTSTSTTSTATGTTTSSATGTWVSPEGVTITIDPDVTGWTIGKVYDLLSRNGYRLSTIGSALTVRVNMLYNSVTSVGVSGTPGSYADYQATIFLDARSSSSLYTFPDWLVAHEYGHAWTLRQLYLVHQGDWSSYLKARGLLGDTRLNTTYAWDVSEIIAEDYRLLLGGETSPLAQMNRDIPDARTVTGLGTFLTTQW